jgi:putative transcriptional regulator
MPMTEKQLLARDAKRDIGAELLLAARQLREGKGKVVARIAVPAVTAARTLITIAEQQPKILKEVFKSLAAA